MMSPIPKQESLHFFISGASSEIKPKDIVKYIAIFQENLNLFVFEPIC